MFFLMRNVMETGEWQTLESPNCWGKRTTIKKKKGLEKDLPLPNKWNRNRGVLPKEHQASVKYYPQLPLICYYFDQPRTKCLKQFYAVCSRYFQKLLRLNCICNFNQTENMKIQIYCIRVNSTLQSTAELEEMNTERLSAITLIKCN